MKELLLEDDRGHQIIKSKIALKGKDWIFDLAYPLLIRLKRISITEEKKEKKA